MNCVSDPRSELAEGGDHAHRRPPERISLASRQRGAFRARLSRRKRAARLDIRTSEGVAPGVTARAIFLIPDCGGRW